MSDSNVVELKRPPLAERLAQSADGILEQIARDGVKILGRAIRDVNTVNGARVTLEDGSWVLVRASSNKPELVAVVESMASEDDMRALFREEVKPRLAAFAEVGAYNQEI